jgi:hypothetical protein
MVHLSVIAGMLRLGHGAYNVAQIAEVFNMSGLSPNAKTLYSFDELLEIEESSGIKHELYDGYIVAMTGGTKAHNLIARNRSRAFLIS